MLLFDGLAALLAHDHTWTDMAVIVKWHLYAIRLPYITMHCSVNPPG